MFELMTAMSDRLKFKILLVLDISMLPLSALLVFALSSDPSLATSPALTHLGMTFAVGLALMNLLSTHRVKLNLFKSLGMPKLFFVAGMLASVSITLTLLTPFDIPARISLATGFIFFLLVCGARMALREFVVFLYNRQEKSMRVVLFGAGQTGRHLAATLLVDKDVQVVAFVDTDPDLCGLIIDGLKVHPASCLEKLVDQMNVDRIIMTNPKLGQAETIDLISRMEGYDVEVHEVPSLTRMLVPPVDGDDPNLIEFSEVTGRSTTQEADELLRPEYSGKSVLVTGAGGSIGSEICLQLARYNPAKIILLDHSELALTEIQKRFADQFPTIPMSCVLGSVSNQTFIKRVFGQYDIDIVFHAAAYKHLPVLEDNIIEGLRNNVLGSRVLAMHARRHNVEKFVLVSSDKAVRPTSWLGVSKRIAEIVVQDLASRSPSTTFSIVRFGNVFDSSGSVVPLFRQQIASGGPVTVTHPDVVRYFMSIPEAVELVLSAATFASGGDVFVLKMGAPVKILNIAKRMIKASGQRIRSSESRDTGIEIKFTGLRPGEKLREELFYGRATSATAHSKILKADEEQPSEIEVAKLLQTISVAVEEGDASAVGHLRDAYICLQPGDRDAIGA